MEITGNTLMDGGPYNGWRMLSIPDRYLIWLYENYKAGKYLAYIEQRFPRLRELAEKKQKIAKKKALRQRQVSR